MMFKGTSEALGYRYLVPPLGLLTVAALLPKSWEIRLIDRNVEELNVEDIDWADVIMTGGMLTQQRDTLEIIKLSQSRKKPVVVGGPDATSSPHVYRSADFRVFGEAENIIDAFIAAWDAGARSGEFEGEKFKADMTKSPLPRYDLINFRYYAQPAVQFSRGCPFVCEFCDIIELYGRVPRTKTPGQVLAELDAICGYGVRGLVMFVDDNLIGNKKELRKLLPLLIDWQKERGYPFEFVTQATVNLGDDPELLKLFSEANFVSVFFGIESPDPQTLISTKKKQNAIRSLTQSVANVHAAGIFVTAGIIIGFDGEKGSVAEGIIEFAELAPIATMLTGPLQALPNTQLSRRLASEGRLHPNAELAPEGDQYLCGLNFETTRPRRDVIADYVAVLDAIYTPEAYFARLRRQVRAVRRPAIKMRLEPRTIFRLVGTVASICWKMTTTSSSVRREFWRTVFDCARHNSGALKSAIGSSCVYYFDLAPLAKTFSKQMKKQLEAIDRGEWQPVPRGAPQIFEHSQVVAVVSSSRAQIS